VVIETGVDVLSPVLLFEFADIFEMLLFYALNLSNL
jgi:hypothetical protein